MKRWIIVTLLVILSLTAAVVLAQAGNPGQEPAGLTATPDLGFSGSKASSAGSGGQREQMPVDSAGSALQDSGRRPSPLLSSGVPVPTPALPVVDTDPDAVYEITAERMIGAYAVRTWRNTASQSLLGFDGIVTIQAAGQPMIQVGSAPGLHELTGTDITGEGNPDVVIETYSGGAHCCFSTIVYDLGAAPLEVLHAPESNCSGYFEDLDNDGTLEFITCDDGLAYRYCCFAGSPMVKVIMKYYPGEGYLPASTKFRSVYADDITKHTAAAEKAVAGEYCEWDETTKCAVLPVVLDYLYAGQWDTAWSEFARLYPYADRDTFKDEIIQSVGMSALYTFP